jgi:putative transposase
MQDGKHWYISLVVRVDQQAPVIIESVVGIDFNSHDFITSDGEAITNPKFLKKSRKLLKRRQRQLAKCVKGSANRKKRQLKLRNTYRKLRNQRKDFVHQVSSSIVKNYDLICLEDLNVKGMQRFKGSMIQDNCFSMLRSAIQYKCIWRGKHFVTIGRFDPSSKTCNHCGHIKKDLSLSDRTYSCSNCGYEEDRDLNAALNIKEWGLFKYLNSTAGTVETGLNHQTNGRGDTTIGVDSNESIRYVSLNRQKFLSSRQEALNASASR